MDSLFLLDFSKYSLTQVLLFLLTCSHLILFFKLVFFNEGGK